MTARCPRGRTTLAMRTSRARRIPACRRIDRSTAVGTIAGSSTSCVSRHDDAAARRCAVATPAAPPIRVVSRRLTATAGQRHGASALAAAHIRPTSRRSTQLRRCSTVELHGRHAVRCGRRVTRRCRSTVLAGGGADRVGRRGEQVGVDRRVDGQRHQRLAAGLAPGHLHGGDVDAGLAQDRADRADHAGPVGVAEEQQDAVGVELQVEAVQLGELARPRGRPATVRCRRR